MQQRPTLQTTTTRIIDPLLSLIASATDRELARYVEFLKEENRTDLINHYAVDFLERHREGPFCLYVSNLAIHNPVQVRGDPVRRSEAEGWKRWKPADGQERIEKFRGITLPIDEGVGQLRRTLNSSRSRSGHARAVLLGQGRVGRLSQREPRTAWP